jgi:DNA-binding transcriptional MerR regulator
MTRAYSEPDQAPSEGGGAETAERLLSIGQLVKELQSDFPDLSISKVRYLEDRGLLTPQRTKGKYRKFSRADLRTLRGVLAMQRDQYLPLDVIRQRVEAAQPGGVGNMTSSTLTSSPTMSLAQEGASYTMQELYEELGLDEDFVLGLIEFRLIDRSSDTGPAFTESDLETARICQRLGRFQVEPRHLRVLSSAVERQAGLVEQVATPALRSGHADRQEYGLETVQELGALFAQLTQLLLRRELRRVLRAGST